MPTGSAAHRDGPGPLNAMLPRLLDAAYARAPSPPHQGRSVETRHPPAHVFDTREQAEDAIRALASVGIETRNLSLVVPGGRAGDRAAGFSAAGDRIGSWGDTGAFRDDIWGLLRSPAVFILPDLGLIALAGPIVAALVSVLDGAVVLGGVSALGAALMQIGVHRDQAVTYETTLKAGKVLLLIHGTVQDMAQARTIMSRALTPATAQ